MSGRLTAPMGNSEGDQQTDCHINQISQSPFVSKSQNVAHRPDLLEEDYPLLGPAVRDGNRGIQELANNPKNNPAGAHGPL